MRKRITVAEVLFLSCTRSASAPVPLAASELVDCRQLVSFDFGVMAALQPEDFGWGESDTQKPRIERSSVMSVEDVLLTNARPALLTASETSIMGPLASAATLM